MRIILNWLKIRVLKVLNIPLYPNNTKQGMIIMEKNMGKKDRAIRGLLGVITLIVGIILLPLVVQVVGILLLIFGGIFIITSLTGFCPLYTIFKFKTLKNESE